MIGQTGISVDTERTVVFLPGLETLGLRWLSFASFGSGAWQGWVAALLMWLVCCWVGLLAGWFPVEAVKSFGEPHSIESSHVGGGSCALCYSHRDFQYPV